MEYASVEANVLAPAVGRHGGQLQVALMGRLAPRRSDGTRIAYVLLAASYLADDIRAGETRGERRGVALDAGIHARLRYGFYALGGVGIAHRSADVVIPDRFERMTTTPRLLFAAGWGF